MIVKKGRFLADAGMLSDGSETMSSGSVFHIRGADSLKVELPTVTV